MPRNSTFLRFTTRVLLLVMLGMSVALAIAFSLLPPLLGITRLQLATGLGWYTLGFSLLLGFACLWRFWTEIMAGECLLSLPVVVPRQGSPWQVGLMCFAISGVYCWWGFGPLARNDIPWTALMFTVAGLAGATGCIWLVWGRLICGIELREHGIVRACGRFFTWQAVQTRGASFSGSVPPLLEFHFASKWHSVAMTEADREAVEAILDKYQSR